MYLVSLVLSRAWNEHLLSCNLNYFKTHHCMAYPPAADTYSGIQCLPAVQFAFKHGLTGTATEPTLSRILMSDRDISGRTAMPQIPTTPQSSLTLKYR